MFPTKENPKRFIDVLGKRMAYVEMGEGDPQDVHDIVQRYGEWLQISAVPKLSINAEPGAILTGPQRDSCRRFPNHSEVTVPVCTSSRNTHLTR